MVKLFKTIFNTKLFQYLIHFYLLYWISVICNNDFAIIFALSLILGDINYKNNKHENF